jgi:hypothetical protein
MMKRLHTTRERRSRKRRPELEALEGRKLMTIGLYPMFGTVNTKTVGAQLAPHNATSADGNSVVVWTDAAGPDHDIRAQRYNSSGGKLGPEILVAGTGFDEYEPSVAIDDQGQFVVSYTLQFGSDLNVMAQRFDSSGNPSGAAITVAPTPLPEVQSSVGIDRQGNFVVAFDRQAYGLSQVYAAQYSSSGQLAGIIHVTSTFNAFANSYLPSVAMSADGRFDVAWEQEYNTTDFDIYANSYTASGVPINSFVVAFTSAFDQTPSIAMDNAGNAVVAWDSGGAIEARRLGLNSIGPPITIIDNPYFRGRDPSVAMGAGGGGFVVVANTVQAGTGYGYEEVFEVSASNAVQGLGLGVLAASASVSIDYFGNYIVTAALSDNPFGVGDYNIFLWRGQLFS